MRNNATIQPPFGICTRGGPGALKRAKGTGSAQAGKKYTEVTKKSEIPKYFIFKDKDG
jgi:hypothetical protein